MRMLVTAGATRNPIDAVRYISASSSGRTGVAVARGLRARGVDVWLMGSPEARLRDGEGEGEEYGSTRDLMTRMEAWVKENPAGGVIHASAVGDYELADDRVGKVPSGLEQWDLALRPTPKIADRVRGWGLRGPYVTFKAAPPETDDVMLHWLASAQRERTGCDWVFANVLGRLEHRILIVGGETRWFEARQDAMDTLVALLAGA